MIYVMSDIHGNERRFDSIMEQINLCEEDSLYILGDVIDRHPGGIRILRRIMNMPNAQMLLGNHEHMMLRALGCPYDPYDIMSEHDIHLAQRLWHHNGGKVTHQYWKRIRKSIRSEVIAYLKDLPLNIDLEVNGKQYKLVHGAPLEDYNTGSIFDDATQFAVWERLRRDDMINRDYTLVFGHTPTEHYQSSIPMEPWFGQNCIGMDCGCGYPEVGYSCYLGRLACICLDNGKVYYSYEKNTLRKSA